MFSFFEQPNSPFASLPDAEKPDGNLNLAAMQFMQSAWTLQMQFAQNLFMMPFYMMQGMAAAMGQSANTQDTAKAAQPGGFKLGGMEIPPELLSMLLQMDMSPENLEKLQGVLDFVFEALPGSRSADAA